MIGIEFWSQSRALSHGGCGVADKDGAAGDSSAEGWDVVGANVEDAGLPIR
jgi:hypothetical protein